MGISESSAVGSGGAARTDLVKSVDALPPAERERAAERLLRRPDVPGPATEHALQHLVGVWNDTGDGKRVDAIAKGATEFYAKQYRQYLNATMGAFAATATFALIGSGTSPREGDSLREVRAALIEGRPGVPPILVLDHQSVAVAVAVPKALTADDPTSFWKWVTEQGDVPDTVRVAIEGQPVETSRSAAIAVERSSAASALEVMAAALTTGKLSVLALHPTDPDAMGLHVTLFGVVGRDAATLAAEYGLDSDALADMVNAGHRDMRDVVFLVGGTEETFTQCSQNLFIKRPPREDDALPVTSDWTPMDPLIGLIDSQFELLQVTVSASGLPGGSPRNGDLGSVAYVVARDNHDVILIPYHPGNFIHGHAAKLWTNPHGAIVVHDDHNVMRNVTLRGPARVLSPDEARRDFPEVVDVEVTRTSDAPGNREPLYWFEQQVLEIIVETEALAPMVLDEGRATCTISAAGQGKYSKKPAYFDAGCLGSYDQALQHLREAAGRPTDPSGDAHRQWVSHSAEKMAARQEHLASIDGA
jgi:hypothetical protein